MRRSISPNFNALVSGRLLISGLLLLLATALNAAESPASSLGNVVVPAPAKPVQAEQCVEPVDVMRREHMEILLHRRDDTVLKGNRSPKYSLSGCIECHAQTSDSGETLRADNPDHFCSSCHLYAGVRIDCFECHADRPLKPISSSQLGLNWFVQTRLQRKLLLRVNPIND